MKRYTIEKVTNKHKKRKVGTRTFEIWAAELQEIGPPFPHRGKIPLFVYLILQGRGVDGEVVFSIKL